MIRLLFIGDVYGKPGRRVVAAQLPKIRSSFDFIVANGENAANGYGLNRESAEILFDSGVNALTLGNHTWDHRDVYKLLEDPRVLRPHNYPHGTPGTGVSTFTVGTEKLTLVNMMGRLFMDPLDCPFAGMNALLERKNLGTVFLDFHAEATSEKAAMGYFLDGRVGGLVGTHTHVATADTRVLPKGTGYQTDAGMTGVLDSVIGAEPAAPIAKFLERIPQRWSTADGRAQMNAVEMHLESNRCVFIQRYQFTEAEIEFSNER